MGSNGASVNGNGREPGHDRYDVPLKPIAWVPKPPPRRPRRWRLRRFDRRSLPLVVLACLAVVILLVVGLSTLSSPLDDVPMVDDDAFVRAANARCEAAGARLTALPSLPADPDPDDRADVVRRYTVVLDDLVASLEALPVSTADTAAVDGWLADWGRHQRARQRLADAFEDGDDDTRTEAQRRRAEALLAVRRFALANSMAGCLLGADG